MSALAELVQAPLRVGAVRAKAAHIARLAPHVREADRAELWAGWRHTPEQSLRYGLEHSSHAWTGLIDCEPVCMFGVVPASLLGGSGVPWLIGTDALVAQQILFLRHCRPHLARMQRLYQHLQNFVAADNTAAVRWLEWMGFTMHEPRPLGPDGALFRRFEWRATEEGVPFVSLRP